MNHARGKKEIKNITKSLVYEQAIKQYAAKNFGKRVLQRSVRQLINKYV
jgi:parvulin-like peptidyl-prolyl isomerase